MPMKKRKPGYAFISSKAAKVQFEVGSRFFKTKSAAMNYAKKVNAKRIKKITFE